MKKSEFRLPSNTSVEPEMRAVTLKGFTELAAELGFDGFKVLREEKLHPDDLSDPEKRFPAKAIVRVLDKAASEGRCPTFGLQMASKRSFEDLGAISLLMQHLPNIREVVDVSYRLRRHYNDLLLVDVKSEGVESYIRWDLQVDGCADQATDLGLGLAFHLFKGVSRGRWKPDLVYVSHSQAGDPSIWQNFFKCPIVFDSPTNGFSCPTHQLEDASPLASQVMADHASNLLQLIEPLKTDTSNQEQVRRLLCSFIPEGSASLNRVARHLDLTPRTLQRYLAAEGCKFEDLLDDEKMNYVRKCLSNPSISLGLLSETLGYSTPSAFSRWFGKKAGISPSAWREGIPKNRQSPQPTEPLNLREK